MQRKGIGNIGNRNSISQLLWFSKHLLPSRNDLVIKKSLLLNNILLYSIKMNLKDHFDNVIRLQNG